MDIDKFNKKLDKMMSDLSKDLDKADRAREKRSFATHRSNTPQGGIIAGALGMVKASEHNDGKGQKLSDEMKAKLQAERAERKQTDKFEKSRIKDRNNNNGRYR